MRIQKFGHACLLVEDQGQRVLFDPGMFSSGFEELRDLTAVLITHVHADHLDVDRIGALVEANPDAIVLSDQDSVAPLAEHGVTAQAVDAGDSGSLGTLSYAVIGGAHAVVHPDIPQALNVGYLLGERFFHPGDALTLPDRPIEILAAPVTGPWQKVSEAVDFVRAVKPRVAVPIHEMVWRRPEMAYTMVSNLAPDGTTVKVIDDGTPVDF
jgi:L-ascorbate metabolism protein UlaG (beta-lactamase superfamily)